MKPNQTASTISNFLYRGWKECNNGHIIQKNTEACKYCNPPNLKITLTGIRDRDAVLSLFIGRA